MIGKPKEAFELYFCLRCCLLSSDSVWSLCESCLLELKEKRLELKEKR